MVIKKVGVVQKCTPVPLDKKGVKKCEDNKIIKAQKKKPLNKDTFEKQQPVDKEGKIVNKNGVINN